MKEAATRNLVDVYRVLGENQKALAALDKALAGQLTTSNRQVFLFTKAKILYSEKRYTAALAIFQQLTRMKLRSAPGSATAEEVDYFRSLCKSKLGNQVEAKAIWKKLASDPFSYYGQRSAEKLGRNSVQKSAPSCLPNRSGALKSIETDITGLRHPLRNEMDSSSDAISELIFLRLWDEAAVWMKWSNSQLPRRQAADVAYLGGQY